jgi:hypothetical protein
MMTTRRADAVLVRFASGRRLGALAAMAIALVLLGLGACSVDRRSDEYRCKNPGQCPSRQCNDGWCVPVPDPVDAAPGASPDGMVTPVPIDAAPQPDECPAVCSSCDNDTCYIECGGLGSCPALVACPAGWQCDVACLGIQACAAGVRCGDAVSCEVLCEGSGACMGGVTCGAGPCSVECLGLSACFTIDCSESCACDTSCEDGALCTHACPDRGGACRRDGECDSTGCDNC